MNIGKSWNKLGRKSFRKERGQLHSRKHLGFLEHHKDYVKRARQYHDKQHQLQHLRLVSALRNPDEFHSDMAHIKAKNGKLLISPQAKMSKSRQKHTDDNNARYLTMRLQNENSKLKRQMQDFHCLESSAKRGKNLDSNEAKAKADHKIFLSDDSQRRSFEASVHFDTVKPLMSQTHNRLKISQLSESKLNLTHRQSTTLRKKSIVKYKQLQSRMKKVNNIKKQLSKTQLKRKLKSGDRVLVYKKRSVDSGKVVQKRYKWPKERKR